MSTDPKFQKWLKWIEQIRDDTESLLINKAIHKRYLEIVKANPDIQSPSDFHEWTVRNYGSYMVMGIRRQLDTDSDVISLRRLLKELKDNPSLLTKKWFRTLYSSLEDKMPIPAESFADGDFERHAGKLEHFDPKIAEDDLAKLGELGKNIITFANKKLAHNTTVQVTVTFNEINAFFEEFEKIVMKYILIFTAAGYDSLTPTWGYDWDEVFTKPWVKIDK
ncbi:hypothetical protein HYW42_05045 [Candidatus Daviesbacteria bacterium]|nr:hypothetical protein [Candidatus Daviesbacteria bacterium]